MTSQPASMRRELNWTGAFWASSGVPAEAMRTIGDVALPTAADKVHQTLLAAFSTR